MGSLTTTSYAGLGQRKMVVYKRPTAVASTVTEPLLWPFGLYVGGYQTNDNSELPTIGCGRGVTVYRSIPIPGQRSRRLPHDLVLEYYQRR